MASPSVYRAHPVGEARNPSGETMKDYQEKMIREMQIRNFAKASGTAGGFRGGDRDLPRSQVSCKAGFCWCITRSSRLLGFQVDLSF